VRSEQQAFKENLSLLFSVVDVFKKSFDAYYIMVKMLGFEHMPLDVASKLQHLVNRARLASKELI